MLHKTARENFDLQLASLISEVKDLGMNARDAVRVSIQALLSNDIQAVKKIISEDQRINEKRYELEIKCIALIATQQPMAHDVRLLAAILEIITEIERIGDYAKGIGKVAVRLKDVKIDDDWQHFLVSMTNKGLVMMEQGLEAFILLDDKAAREIPGLDDEVDEIYNQLADHIAHSYSINPSNYRQAQCVLWAAHNLERLADRVTNICERIVYVQTGEISEFDNPEIAA